jgi:hypothetical protein
VAGPRKSGCTSPVFSKKKRKEKSKVKKKKGLVRGRSPRRSGCMSPVFSKKKRGKKSKVKKKGVSSREVHEDLVVRQLCWSEEQQIIIEQSIR